MPSVLFLIFRISRTNKNLLEPIIPKHKNQKEPTRTKPPSNPIQSYPILSNHYPILSNSLQSSPIYSKILCFSLTFSCFLLPTHPYKQSCKRFLPSCKRFHLSYKRICKRFSHPCKRFYISCKRFPGSVPKVRTKSSQSHQQDCPNIHQSLLDILRI